MVEFQYNELMERYDVQLPFELGDIKDMKTVAHIKDDKIYVLKELTISMVQNIINHWLSFKVQLDRNPLDDLDSRKEQEFEPYPDGEDHVQG